MKLLILALLVVLVFTDLSTVANTPIPAIVVGTPSSQYIGGSAASTYYFKTVQAPSWVTIGTDGLLSCNAPTTGAWPVSVQIYDKASGQSQSRQYNLRVINNNSALWSQGTTNYYQRKTSGELQVVVNTNNTSNLKINVGSSFNYQFSAANNNGSLVYAFFGLPNGLFGDRTNGKVSGLINNPGIYTFGCEVADQSGNSAEEFVSVTVVGSSSNVNATPVLIQQTFSINLTQVGQTQVAADQALFNALAAVNAAKATLAAKQAVLTDLTNKLAVAQTSADNAASITASLTAARENAAQRLSLTNKALSDAEDQLNLALLDQAGSLDSVNTANSTVNAAQTRFNNADAALKTSQLNLQTASAALNNAKQALLLADNSLKSAQQDFQRASTDLNAAKDALSAAIARQNAANSDVSKANGALDLAQQAYNDANDLLATATLKLSQADLVRQNSLGVLQNSTLALQQSNSDLSAANWQLQLASQALITAQARKTAADRASALALAQGSTSLNGSSVAFTPTVAQSQYSSSSNTYIIQTNPNFGSCNGTTLPRFSGSCQVTNVTTGSATLATGLSISFGDCTQGYQYLQPGNQVVVDGVINVDQKSIQAYSVKPASM